MSARSWVQVLLEVSFEGSTQQRTRGLELAVQQITAWSAFSEEVFLQALYALLQEYCEQVSDFPFLKQSLQTVIEEVRRARRVELRLEVQQNMEEDAAELISYFAGAA